MASSDDQRPIIVIKKIKKGGHGHHGGAWKIAYADFVTAMMAFFLLMWLLGSTSEGDLKGISDYFNSPLKVALTGGSGSGTATSVIDAGGTDLARPVGQIRSSASDSNRRPNDSSGQSQAFERAESQRLLELKGEIEGLIDASDLMKQFKNQIMLDLTPEGLRIQIVDERSRPMFDVGSAVLKDYMQEILVNITKVLKQVPNKLTLSGHTDATQYAAGAKGYSNWELSTDRANASRRVMMATGMPDTKILRVMGLASSLPLDEQDPYAAVNRRITIVVMNKKSEDAVRNLANSDNAQGSLVDLPPVPKLNGLPFPAAKPGNQ